MWGHVSPYNRNANEISTQFLDLSDVSQKFYEIKSAKLS